MNHPAIHITQMSNVEHTAQIVTGIHLLKNHGYRVTIPHRSHINKLRHPHMAIVEVEYRAKKIIYDVLDGYQYPEEIQYYLDNCDFYFKRSFSEDKNQALLQRYEGKIFPLGFNYHVTFLGNPTNENLFKSITKALVGKTPKVYYTPRVFEEKPTFKESHFKILFITRLWDDRDPALSPQLNQERARINQMRIEIIRTMRNRFGDQFIGGLNNEPIAQKYAPDTIL